MLNRNEGHETISISQKRVSLAFHICSNQNQYLLFFYHLFFLVVIKDKANQDSIYQETEIQSACYKLKWVFFDEGEKVEKSLSTVQNWQSIQFSPHPKEPKAFEATKNKKYYVKN